MFITEYESTDQESLVVRIEQTKDVVTIYGRVNDDYVRWADEMQQLIKAIKPDTTAHFSDEARKKYHPNGSAKGRGYKYFHHVHSTHSLKDTVELIKPWMPKGMYKDITKDLD